MLSCDVSTCSDPVNYPTITCYLIISNDNNFKNKRENGASVTGNSGLLIFDGKGHMVSILHSGMLKDGSNHVTYATPTWWVIEQLKLKDPHTNFNHATF